MNSWAKAQASSLSLNNLCFVIMLSHSIHVCAIEEGTVSFDSLTFPYMHLRYVGFTSNISSEVEEDKN